MSPADKDEIRAKLEAKHAERRRKQAEEQAKPVPFETWRARVEKTCLMNGVPFEASESELRALFRVGLNPYAAFLALK